jgi:hypothetical protein
MSNQKGSVNGIEISEDFPYKPYSKVGATMATILETYPKEWSEFGGSWNSVAYRFKAFSDSDELFTFSVNKEGPTPPHPERYTQENSLFIFFVAGLSVIESLTYAMYMIGSIVKPQDFPITNDDIKNIYPELVRDKYNKNFKNDAITKILTKFLISQEYHEWKEIRNILIHRTTPGRNMTLGSSRDEGTYWQHDMLPINNQLTSQKRRYLSQNVSEMMIAIEQFTSNRIQKK